MLPNVQDTRVKFQIRVAGSLHEELAREAKARDVSLNYLINRAIEQLLGKSHQMRKGKK